jgi:hypothetical protein
VVSIWSHSQVENWSAFAPDFRELEENVEYHERESEFDIKDEDRSLDGLDYNGSPNKRQRADTDGNMKKKEDDDGIEIDVVTDQRIEALVSSDDDDINDQLVYLPVAPDIEDPETEFPAPVSNVPKTRTSPLLQARVEADETFEIQLKVPPVHDAHPYYGGTKQPRSTVNTAVNVQDSISSKRELKNRRKGHHHHHHHHHQHPIQHQNSIIQPVLLPKSIDAAVATVINNPKRQLVTQTSEVKGQRARSARLEGKKAAATAPVVLNTQTSVSITTTTEETVSTTRTKRSSHHTHSTDNDTDFVSH